MELNWDPHHDWVDEDDNLAIFIRHPRQLKLTLDAMKHRRCKPLCAISKALRHYYFHGPFDLPTQLENDLEETEYWHDDMSDLEINNIARDMHINGWRVEIRRTMYATWNHNKRRYERTFGPMYHFYNPSNRFNFLRNHYAGYGNNRPNRRRRFYSDDSSTCPLPFP